MKALNRAIGRTVSQLARYGAEGCHPPMLMALENHLDALLTMERKQLEVAGIKSGYIIPGADIATGDGTGEVLPGLAQHLRTALRPFSSPLIVADRFATKMPVQEWAQQTVASFNNLTAEQVREIHQSAGLQQEPPSLRPQHWLAGDKIFFVGSGDCGFTNGKAYTIEHISMLDGFVTIRDDAGNQRQIAGDAWLTANFKNYSRSGDERTDEQADVEHHAAKVLDAMAAPAPDVIDMNDSRNWLVGDVLMCSDGNAFLGFNAGDECALTEKHETYVVVRRNHGTAVALHHGLPASNAFTWLRHGEAQQ